MRKTGLKGDVKSIVEKAYMVDDKDMWTASYSKPHAAILETIFDLEGYETHTNIFVEDRRISKRVFEYSHGKLIAVRSFNDNGDLIREYKIDHYYKDIYILEQSHYDERGVLEQTSIMQYNEKDQKEGMTIYNNKREVMATFYF